MQWRTLLSSQMLVAILVFAGSKGYSQNILDNYVKKGLDSNLAIRQKGFDLQRAQVDLKRAQSLFYPRADFNSTYTLASGGRTQDVPIGDLLNDVYSTLNQLTGTSKFPRVDNQDIKFLPNNFHDTRLEVSMPVINTEIRYNRTIKEELIRTQQADIDVYKRELVKTIKEAWYRYLQAVKAIDIYTNALGLVNENRRVSEKLIENGKATKEILLRAKAQVSQVEASLIEAKNNRQNAAAYFNFLLNQPLDAPVEVDEAVYSQLTISVAPAFEVPAGREELAKLRSAQKVLTTNLKLNRSLVIPKLNAFYNVGFQGFGFKFNNDQFYQLGGLQLQWNLFRGYDNRYKVRQSQIDLDAISNQYKDVEHQLTLQVYTAYNNYRSALQTLQSVSDEVQSTQETYRLTERKFREGLALQIELIDARTQLTNAQLKYSLSQLAVLSKAAELERVTATYKF